MELNPYQAPNADLSSATPRALLKSHEVDPRLVEPLTRAKPWLRVVSTFLWLCSAGLLVATVYLIQLAPRSSGALSTAALLCLLLAGLWMRAALHAWSCGANLRRSRENPTRSDLRAALEALRVFWTSMGISMPVLLLALIATLVVTIQLLTAPDAFAGSSP